MHSQQKAIVAGVGPEAPTVTLENGAKQSATPARLDLIPMRALLHVGGILQEGAKKYGIDNWRGIPVESHLNKALIHIAAYLLGDTQDDHLGHACCRLQMALERHLMDAEAPDPVDPKTPTGFAQALAMFKRDLETATKGEQTAVDQEQKQYWTGRVLTIKWVVSELENLK